ncbi:hypothetical protein RJT34_10344 [Clitoria ternatea]|uniref:Uncharacterized protein n=1 Tax=Clitoria ternatea TaxID=43366 RepID=A0AAN9K5Y9_CLITE
MKERETGGGKEKRCTVLIFSSTTPITYISQSHLHYTPHVCVSCTKVLPPETFFNLILSFSSYFSPFPPFQGW